MSQSARNYEENVIRTLPGHLRLQMGQLALAGYKFECTNGDKSYGSSSHLRYWRCYRPDGSKVTFSGGQSLWGDLKSMIESLMRWDGVKLGLREQEEMKL